MKSSHIFACLPACLLIAVVSLAEPAHAFQVPFEVPPQFVQYVNPLNNGPANGSSMALGFPSLDDAIDPATNSLLFTSGDLTIELRLLGNQIYVPDGTIRFPANSPDARHASFALPSQILRVSGGWTGLEGPNDPPAGRPSTLSGDRGVPGDPADNCYHVVVPFRSDFSTSRDAQWLNYLIVEGGNANGTPVQFDNLGGGILNAGGQVRLTEVTIRDCFAEFGGGIASVEAALPGPGGVLVAPSFWARRSTFRDCNAGQDGGAILVDRCSRVVLVNLVCRNNAAIRDGGGIWVGARIPDHAIVNSVFHDNVAGELGGALYVSDHFGPNAGLRIVNGTIAYNSASLDFGLAGGSGIYIEIDSGATGQPAGLGRTALVNTILYANPGGSNDDNILLAPPVAPAAHLIDVSNCFIGGRTTNPGTTLTTGTQSYGLPPPAIGFIDAGQTGEVPGWVGAATRNFRLVSNSRCIEQGTDLALDPNSAGTDWVDLDGDFLYFEQTIPVGGQLREELCREHFMGDEVWLSGSISTREVRIQGAGASTLPNIGQNGGQVAGAITDIGAFEYRIYAIGV